MGGQELLVGWADTLVWDGDDHDWLYLWIDQGMTDMMLYKGFRDAGARCIGARIVQEPTSEEPVGIGAVNFRQACPVLSTYPQSCIIAGKDIRGSLSWGQYKVVCTAAWTDSKSTAG